MMWSCAKQAKATQSCNERAKSILDSLCAFVKKNWKDIFAYRTISANSVRCWAEVISLVSNKTSKIILPNSFCLPFESFRTLHLNIRINIGWSFRLTGNQWSQILVFEPKKKNRLASQITKIYKLNVRFYDRNIWNSLRFVA